MYGSLNGRRQEKAGDYIRVDTLTRLGSISGSPYSSALPGSEAR